MSNSTNNEQQKADQEQIKSAKSHKMTSRAFWITIIVLAVCTVMLGFVSTVRSPKENATLSDDLPEITRANYEIPETILEGFIKSAAEKAHDEISERIDAVLYKVYAPVYAAIPEYTSFHYSVLGEYIELTQAAMGQMAQSLQKTLYSGFSERMQQAGIRLDQEYTSAFKTALQAEIESQFPADAPNISLGPITLAAIQNAENRIKVTASIGTVAMVVTGSGIVKKTIAIFAKKIATKVAAKAAAKGVVKETSALAGAGGGALLCSWSGPGAALCGVVGGVAAWFIMDSAVINLDEYFNRDEFEADLRQMIDADRAEKARLFRSTLERKSKMLGDTDFTLRQLPEPGDR